ncbi:MAG TPA: hypothetical protein VK746_04440 [Candidatus Eisenbacteria bacterium]|nr:hypothetical protein [Candidatus Eisenbacteria bacterium]
MIAAIYARKSTSSVWARRGGQEMTADHLYPRITGTGPSLKRDMVWQDLLEFGAPGATPMELAARPLRDGKATGTVEGCAVRLMPLLEELVGMVGEHRTERAGERFRARRPAGS